MNNIKYIFIIIIIFGNVITFAETDKKYYEDKLVSLAKELEIIDEKSEFPEIYVKKKEYREAYRKQMINEKDLDLQKAHNEIVQYCKYYNIEFMKGIKQVLAYDKYLREVGQRQQRLDEFTTKQDKLKTPVSMKDFMELGK